MYGGLFDFGPETKIKAQVLDGPAVGHSPPGIVKRLYKKSLYFNLPIAFISTTTVVVLNSQRWATFLSKF